MAKAESGDGSAFRAALEKAMKEIAATIRSP